MGLFSFFQRKRQERQRSQAVPIDAGTFEEVRTRARRRLIGAVVLVVAAVVVLPLLFDTKPRQLPASIDLQVERPDAASSPVAVVVDPAPGARRTDQPATPTPATPAAPEPAVAQAPATAAATRPAESKGRFVIQVGAFEQAAAAREVRQRIEKLGLPSYQQEVSTSAGKRIRVRVGPYGSRDDADRVAVQVRASGLTATVLAL
jgi:DedD protein